MPPPLARLRRRLGRLLADGGAGQRPRGRGDGTHTIVVVPLTVRSRAADGADIRLLLEARLTSARLPREEVERIALALVVPAAARWVRRHGLRALDARLGPTLPEVEASVREPVAALGADLLAVTTVAVEHLLASPSADRDPGGAW